MRYETSGNITRIYVSQGRSFLIDTDQLEKVMQYSWHVTTKGYIRTSSRKLKRIALHKFLMKTDEQIDHINRDKTDNRLANLRVCTTRENNFNRRGWSKSKTGFKGVTYDNRKKKYKARIGIDNKRIHIGYFDTAEEASRAYNEMAEKLYGEYAPR